MNMNLQNKNDWYWLQNQFSHFDTGKFLTPLSSILLWGGYTQTVKSLKTYKWLDLSTLHITHFATSNNFTVQGFCLEKGEAIKSQINWHQTNFITYIIQFLFCRLTDFMLIWTTLTQDIWKMKYLRMTQMLKQVVMKIPEVS